MKHVQRDTSNSRPKVLLLEPKPDKQLKIERALKRAGFSCDLAIDASVAAQFATREQYGVLMVPLGGCGRDAQRQGAQEAHASGGYNVSYKPPSYPTVDQLKVV